MSSQLLLIPWKPNVLVALVSASNVPSNSALILPVISSFHPSLSTVRNAQRQRGKVGKSPDSCEPRTTCRKRHAERITITNISQDPAGILGSSNNLHLSPIPEDRRAGTSHITLAAGSTSTNQPAVDAFTSGLARPPPPAL